MREGKAKSESRQLERFRRQLARPETKVTFVVMITLAILFQMFDQMATGIYSNFQEAVVRDFAGLSFDADITAGAPGYDAYQNTLSTITLASMIGFGFMGVTPWYKAMADKYGRKPFFVINAFFLALALIMGGITHDLTIFVVATLLITFFTIHDIQILYVTECVPDRQRGMWQGIIAAAGSLAGVLTTGARFLALQPDGTVGAIPWRLIFILVGVFGLLIFVFALALLRESHPFLVSRVAYLETPEEERRANARAGKQGDAGVVSAFRLILKNRQLRWISIATLLFSTANNMVTSYNNTIMAQNGMGTIGITLALMVAMIVAVPLNLLIGPLSDLIGRKLTSAIGALASAIAFAVLVFFGGSFTDTVGGGIFNGIMVGISIWGYGTVGNLTTLMMSESCPSSMRGSIIGVRSFFMVTAVVSIFLSGMLFPIMPTGQVCFWLAVPFLALSSVCILLKTKETKGLTIEEIDAQFE